MTQQKNIEDLLSSILPSLEDLGNRLWSIYPACQMTESEFLADFFQRLSLVGLEGAQRHGLADSTTLAPDIYGAYIRGKPLTAWDQVRALLFLSSDPKVAAEHLHEIAEAMKQQSQSDGQDQIGLDLLED